jgi:hypothetical protein
MVNMARLMVFVKIPGAGSLGEEVGMSALLGAPLYTYIRNDKVK